MVLIPILLISPKYYQILILLFKLLWIKIKILSVLAGFISAWISWVVFFISVFSTISRKEWIYFFDFLLWSYSCITFESCFGYYTFRSVNRFYYEVYWFYWFTSPIIFWWGFDTSYFLTYSYLRTSSYGSVLDL